MDQNFEMEWSQNSSLEENSGNASYYYSDNIMHLKSVQALFYSFYTIIFVLGLLGNILVCTIVIRSKAMHSVTNAFITNLALSDILLCIFAVPFTPLYAFRGTWGWGSTLCYIMPFAQGCSVYVSTYTLMCIAINRFFVIIYPFRNRMKMGTCVIVIFMIWTFAMIMNMPIALFMTYYEVPGVGWYCEEMWPSLELRQAFGTGTAIMQFVLPFTVITICYTRVSCKLSETAKAKATANNTRQEEIDNIRKRRTNQMLIAMVTIFGISWMPLNLINVFNDYYVYAIYLKWYFMVFFIFHAMAMSSTFFNPFIYAWMNEHFQKELKLLFPCLETTTLLTANFEMEPMGPTNDSNLGTSSQRGMPCRNEREPSAAADEVRSGLELDEGLVAVDVEHCHTSASYNLRLESVKLHLISDEFDGTPA